MALARDKLLILSSDLEIGFPRKLYVFDFWTTCACSSSMWKFKYTMSNPEFIRVFVCIHILAFTSFL